MPLNAKWFQARIVAQGLTQRKVAAALDIDPAGVTQIFKGKRKLALQEATTLAKLLNCSLNDVLANAGLQVPETSARRAVQITGRVNSEMKVEWGKAKGPKLVPGPVSAALGGQTDRLRGLRVQTAGTAFDGLNNAIVFYDQEDRACGNEVLSSECIGCLSLLKLAQSKDEWIFGVLRRGVEAGVYDVVTIAGETMIESVRIAAVLPVLWIKI